MSATMHERLTWKQIQEKYPDQWVALTDVRYIDNDGCNVESAIVICGMSDDKYIGQRLSFIEDGKDYLYERTEDRCNFIGVTLHE